MSYKVEALPDSNCLLGEGPHWDIEKQSMYFVDIDNAELLRHDYAQNKIYRCKIENEKYASFIIPIEGADNKFIVGIERRVAIINWDGVSNKCKVEGNVTIVEEGDASCTENRINDGKCDPRGRLFTGTMHRDLSTWDKRTGHFYNIDEFGKSTHFLDKIGISNGLAWNEKKKTFYYNDSYDRKTREFDYDINTGLITNPRYVFSLEKYQKDGHIVIPDGMTIDSEGYLYVAVFGASSVMKVDPSNGKVLLEIKVPCDLVTSAAFGGPNLDILYVTTARLLNYTEPAGTIYKVTGLGSKGLPMTKYKLSM